MDIPAPKTGEDIYSFGFDQNLNKFPEGTSTGQVYATVDDQVNTGSILSGGDLTLKTLTVGGLVKQVAPGDDIQAAIDAVNREGGGTVQLLAKTYTLTSNINLKSNVSLVGAGKDITILNFNNVALGVNIIGTSTLSLQNIQIKDLTIQNSNNIAGLDIDFCNFWRLEEVRVTSCLQNGIRVQDAGNFLMFNVRSDTNTSSGFLFQENSNATAISTFSLINCQADTNTLHGFYLNSDRGTNYRLYDFTLLNCHAESNGGRGFYFNASVAVRMDGRVANCYSISNTSSGFDVNSNVTQIYFIGCIPDSNGIDGLHIDGQHCTIVGCRGNGTNTTYDLNVTNDYNVVIGSNFYNGAALGSTFMNFDPTKAIIVDDNSNSGLKLNRKFIQAKNTSGGTIPAGAVIVYNPASADPEQVTTTTTNGDNKVVGMMLTNTGSTSLTSNNSVGKVLTEGYTTQLYVSNGTSSISIGNYLSTYSHAYYAKKAVTGDMVFAMALSAPSTGTAQINALLVSPRLI